MSSDPARPDEPPAIHMFVKPEKQARTFRLGLVLLIAIVGTIVVLPFAFGLSALATYIGVSKEFVFIPALIAVSFGVAGLVRLAVHHRHRRFARFLDANAALPFHDIIRAALARDRRAAQPAIDIAGLLHALAARGHTGDTIVASRWNQVDLGEPIAVPFEPQILDQHDETFQQIMDNQPATPARPKPPRVSRAVAWTMLIVFGLNVIIAALQSYHRHTITWPLLLWSASLVLQILVGLTPKLHRNIQWFVVPGGLIVRKPRGVHLFKRTESLLFLNETVRDRWIIVVADGEAAETYMATTPEVDFTLRAWRSLLPPPDPNRLSDFA